MQWLVQSISLEASSLPFKKYAIINRYCITNGRQVSLNTSYQHEAHMADCLIQLQSIEIDWHKRSQASALIFGLFSCFFLWVIFLYKRLAQRYLYQIKP